MTEEQRADSSESTLAEDTTSSMGSSQEDQSPAAAGSTQGETVLKKRSLKVVFDVMNSVKGGSGKSTLALQLAAFWNSQPCTGMRTRAYVIDLDLRGTSWANGYASYLDEERKKGKRYITEMLYDTPSEDGALWELPFTYKTIGHPKEDASIQVCVGNPNFSDEITPLKSDLLENAVYKIIRKILDGTMDDGSSGVNGAEGAIDEVHIIFDMPPSYEAHAERVFTHLLMDKDSKLIKELQDKDKFQFKINLFMIFALSKAHLDQDLVYVRKLLKHPVFSSYIFSFIEGGNFSIYFLGNDTTDAINLSSEQTANIIAAVKSEIDKSKDPIFPPIFKELKDMAEKKMFIIQHFTLDTIKGLMNGTVDVPELQTDAEKIFRQIYDLK